MNDLPLIIPALATSGQGRRLWALAELAGKPLIAHVLDAHQAACEPAAFGHAVVLTSSDHEQPLTAAVDKRARVLALDLCNEPSGLLEQLPTVVSASPVIFHDATWAIVPPAVVRALREKAAELTGAGAVNAVAPVVAVTDSIKAASSSGMRNLDRGSLVTVQQPVAVSSDVVPTVLSALAQGACPLVSEPAKASDDAPATPLDTLDPAAPVGELVIRSARIRTIEGAAEARALTSDFSVRQAELALAAADLAQP